jgi:hypothetical protein
MPTPIVPIKTGDVVRLKKPHPCGENSWEVVRVGMDIGLRCRGCDRKVMLVRSEFDRRFRGFIERADGSAEESSGDAASHGRAAGADEDATRP